MSWPGTEHWLWDVAAIVVLVDTVAFLFRRSPAWLWLRRTWRWWRLSRAERRWRRIRKRGSQVDLAALRDRDRA